MRAHCRTCIPPLPSHDLGPGKWGLSNATSHPGVKAGHMMPSTGSANAETQNTHSLHRILSTALYLPLVTCHSSLCNASSVSRKCKLLHISVPVLCPPSTTQDLAPFHFPPLPKRPPRNPNVAGTRTLDTSVVHGVRLRMLMPLLVLSGVAGAVNGERRTQAALKGLWRIPLVVVVPLVRALALTRTGM
ncbi:hypothetical protein ACN47E_008433 [Coniothyrium glycines]